MKGFFLHNLDLCQKLVLTIGPQALSYLTHQPLGYSCPNYFFLPIFNSSIWRQFRLKIFRGKLFGSGSYFVVDPSEQELAAAGDHW